MRTFYAEPEDLRVDALKGDAGQASPPGLDGIHCAGFITKWVAKRTGSEVTSCKAGGAAKQV